MIKVIDKRFDNTKFEDKRKNDIMQIGADKAYQTMVRGIGGPFGAVITKDDRVVAIASNTVLRDNDPTCHAEMNAIREACKVLGTYDLSGCEILATGAPCPMCQSAIIWANIKKVYVSGTVEDAAEIGFRDDYIYKFIEGGCADKSVLEIEQLDNKPAKMLYKEYAEMQKTIY